MVDALDNKNQTSADTNDRPPTDPSTITHDTSLKSLNLDWRERELPERERTKHVHRLHPYLGKFIPQLVEVFLRKYFSPRQTVLDPFVGSGTTLVQANELNINAIGYDISAFNILLCKTKTAVYDLKQARLEVLDALGKVQSATRRGTYQLSLFNTDAPSMAAPETKNDYLRQWFSLQALDELLTYREVVSRGDYEYHNLMHVILARSARSARLTTHFDLDFPKQPQREPYWCYKHSRMCQPTEDALKFLERYSLDTLARIEQFAACRTDAHITVHHADSRTADFGPIDGVITSPPYVGLIDYHEQHAYAYHLLGLEDRRTDEIGAAAHGNSKKAVAHYLQDMVQVFGNAVSAIKPGGLLIVVAADRANLYDKIAQQIGVQVEAVIQRHVNRRTGRRAGEFYESIFVWRKV